MKRKIVAAALLMVAALSANSAHALNLVANGGFEEGLSGWVKNGADIQVDPYWPHSGNYAVEFATKNELGSMSQVVQTIPGLTYSLSYYLIGAGGYNEFMAVVDGRILIDDNNVSSTPYTYFTFNFTAGESPTEIAFYSQQQYGAHLDDVSVAPVPEPATLLIFGAGLVGAGFVRRRTRI